jgi:glycerol uptake facilitator-like aquaporin
MFTDSFSGISPSSVLGFILAQIIGALIATVIVRLFFKN